MPSVFEVFLNYLEKHEDERYKFNSVRYVFLSGEALAANLVQRLYALYENNNVSVHNLYGPTECAVDVTYYDCTPDDTDPVPIGKPIYNTGMYVLDKYLKPVPFGVKGELCIGGDNVGQGYLNNPVLTAEKFIDNPFGEGKIYKTGDLACWREDGNIIFCGRMDGQIKLNGQRIETGEIEAVINELSVVDSVAVIVRNVNSADILVAFYTGKTGQEGSIKEYCREKLPAYMVPGVVMHLKALPLNSSGKLDVRSLKNTELVFDTAVQSEEPVNNTEKRICEAFEAVLGVQNVGRSSDFFDIGGTSLSMITLLGEEFFESISPAEFIRNSTPARLAILMSSQKKHNLEYLEPLHIAEKQEKAMIVLPFAGGTADAYGKFVNELSKKDENLSVYFVRYLHSADECEKAAEEIEKALCGYEVYVYSHCVGSAVAMKILEKLEKDGFDVKHYYAAAAIPALKADGKNLWNSIPDFMMKAVLVKSGARLKDLPEKKQKDIFARFRKDTDFASHIYSEADLKIRTPLTVIISKKDLFTKNYRQAEKCWGSFAENLGAVRFIETKSHYFQTDNAAELIDMILKK